MGFEKRIIVHSTFHQNNTNIKFPLHAKMGSIKNRNGMDLTEAKDIKKRWQEYAEELYKKDLHDPDNHDGVITHLEPDILNCEVKWVHHKRNIYLCSWKDLRRGQAQKSYNMRKKNLLFLAAAS